MNSNLQSILEPQEKIIWQGVINRHILGFTLAFVLFLWLFFTVIIFAMSLGNTSFVWFISLVFLFFILLNFFKDYVKEFVITDKRIIISSGIIGTDYNSIYFTKIKTVNVKVGLFDRIFGVGTINIDTGKVETVANKERSVTQTAYDKLLYINKPYEVYKILQSTLSNRQERLYSGRVDLK